MAALSALRCPIMTQAPCRSLPMRAAHSQHPQLSRCGHGHQKPHRISHLSSTAEGAVVMEPGTRTRRLAFPFTRIAGQEELKLALLLNVVDPSIGGALIMGDRGTGKSVAVRLVLHVEPSLVA